MKHLQTSSLDHRDFERNFEHLESITKSDTHNVTLQAIDVFGWLRNLLAKVRGLFSYSNNL